MAVRRTWIWVLVGSAGAGIVVLLAVAGSGIYFVTHHVRAERGTGAEAVRSFDTVLRSLGAERPLYELDGAEEPRLVRPLAELPSAATRADTLRLLAWDPEQERIVHISLPFWLLRFGHHHVRVTHDDRGFDFERLNLDIDELARIGPTLVFDFRNQDGMRVLLWTE